MKWYHFLILIPVIIGGCLIAFLQSDIFDILLDLVDWLKGNVETIKTQLSTFFTFLTIFIFLKLKLWDVGTYNKLQKAHGKDVITKALDSLIRLIKIFGSEKAVMKRIMMADNFDAKVIEASQEIRGIIHPIAQLPLKISKREEKRMDAHIREMFMILAKTIEIEKIKKEEDFVEKLTKTIQAKEKYTDADKILKENGKNVLLDLPKK